MRIALDFDDTFTRDPVLWRFFVDSALKRNHEVRIVTFRSDNENNRDIEVECRLLGIPVIYTGGQRKRPYCYAQGFQPHVWIDDMPEIIVEDYS